MTLPRAFVIASCNYCHKPRKVCTCVASGKRPTNNDPIHTCFAVVLQFMEDAGRFFGRDAHDEALVLIASVLQEKRALMASGQLSGFEYKRIDSDAHRLIAKAAGKLYATQQRFIEKKEAEKSGVKRLSNSEVLQKFLASQRVVVA